MKRSDDEIDDVCALMDQLDRLISVHPHKDSTTAYENMTENQIMIARKKSISHHYDFLRNLKIKQTSVDPYKVISWYGFYLSEVTGDAQKTSVLLALQLMNNMLKYDDNGKPIANDLIAHLWKLSINDKCQDEFGVGKNGIYSVFTAASMFRMRLDRHGWVV